MTGRDCLAYRCAVYDATSPQEPISPESGAVRLAPEVGEAVPFAVVDGNGSIVVDPNPIELGAPITSSDAPGEDDRCWTPPEDVSTHDDVLLPDGVESVEAARDLLGDVLDGTPFGPGETGSGSASGGWNPAGTWPSSGSGPTR